MCAYCNKREDFDFEDDDFLRQYTEKMLSKSIFTEFTDEESLINLSMHQKLIVHFYSRNFKKCRFMNESLRKIAVKFPDIKFGFIDVENCPKMCQALKIKVLPFLGFFKDGFFIEQLVGFEKIGNSEIFKIEDLENFIKSSEICSTQN
jgi:thioredoxin-like negative regulator of GroEL